MFSKMKIHRVCLVLIVGAVAVAFGEVGSGGHEHAHVDLDHVENPSYSGLSSQQILKIAN